MSASHTCASIYLRPDQVSGAVALLQAAGFDLGLLSVVARDNWRTPQELGPLRSGGEIVYGGAREGFWERIWSALPGKAGLWLYKSGPLLLAGRIARDLTAEAATGDSFPEPQTIEEVLLRAGIPQSNVARYAVELGHHRILLFVEGDVETIDRAERALERTRTTNNTLHHGA